MADFKINTNLYGDAEVNNNQKQVRFVITGSTSKGNKGTAGSGIVEFSKTEHVIYVDGVKYGGVDAAGQDIGTNYALKTDVSNNVNWLDASVQSHLDASVTALETLMSTNQTNLRLFKTIGGVDASNNSGVLDFLGSDGLTIARTSANDSSIQFTLNVATADKIGGVKSGSDITVATGGSVTVQKIKTAAVTTTSAGSYNFVASGIGDSQELKTVSALQTIVDADGSVHIQYTGKYVSDNDIATKKHVDAIAGAAVDGMHMRGTLTDSSIDNLPSSPEVGDMYIANITTAGESKTVNGQTVQSGDYIIYTEKEGWKVVNRNITETTTIGTADSGSIPTEGAVISYVSGQITASNENAKWLKTIKVGESSIAADSSNDTFEFTAGTDVTIDVDSTNKKLTFTHSTVSNDSSTETQLDLTSGTDTFSVLTDVSISSTGHLIKRIFRTIDVAGAVTSRIIDSSATSTSVNTTYSQNVLSQTLFWEVVD